jgi:hypothetical protein
LLRILLPCRCVRSVRRLCFVLKITRHFLSEAEDKLAELVENIRSSTQKIDEMCSGTVASVRATVNDVNKSPTPVAEPSPVVQTRAQRARAAKEKAEPEKQEIPVTRPTGEEVLLTSPSAAEKPKSFGNFFVGTSNDASDGIAAVEERRFLVLSRIHPDTTSDKIVNFIRRKTGLTNIRCHLMIPRGKTVNELEYVSFKVGVEVDDYSTLMVPELWPAKVLVRDFEKRNRRLKPTFARF